MLFTDIEGSTQLVQRLGVNWPDALDTHRRVCREAWSQWGGHEVDTAGDGFFVVFPEAVQAVGAAVAAQRGLVGASWAPGEPVRVRMGVHAGEVTAYDGSYIGYEVHRAARVAAAAHGGQVLVSGPAVEALGDLEGAEPPGGAGVGLVDLGRYPLKDLAVDEQLFQVTAEGLVAGFPPVRSVGSPSAQAGLEIPPTMTKNAVDLPPAGLTLNDGRIVEVTGYGVRIGRTPDNDLVLGDSDASRHHAVVSATNGGFVLTDVASTNGTRVNGTRVEGARLLADGDVIGVGATEMRFTWPLGAVSKT